MTTNRRHQLRTLSCPQCGQKGNLQRILYGTPSDDFDFQKYAVGGCCISGDRTDPDIPCKNYSWSD